MFSKKFGKFFSKLTAKTDVKSNDETLNAIEIEQLIKESLTHYISDNFPQGVLAVCLQFSVTQSQKPKHKNIIIDLLMPFVCQGELDLIAQSLSDNLARTVTVKVELAIKPVRQFCLGSDKNKAEQGSTSQGNIANIIAIASGKGGVGKSTTTVNIAYALMAEGAKVGILDADIYGPSIPTMLGLKNEKPSSSDGKLMMPLNANGISAMSIGFLVDEADATVWRGPMASTAFNQLLNETDWPELDYLLIDMPPGTGDIQLTLAQKVPVAAAVIVTTPQDIALIDAVKGIAMFDKVKVPVLGIIENMSYHICEHCGHQSYIFGEAGAEQMAKDQQSKLLGQIPLDIAIRQDADFGESDVFEHSTGEIASYYRKIARNISAQLFLQCDNASPLTATVTTKAI
ncbi:MULTISPECIES: iron-sulfur cluster carrier protein ApbC [Colwellia]|uniref:Iron-sulfur cluster carrier protein n=1 Tax=Colwellia marinimaniae TaxID=1513592 RepID=A0ABQ0MV07_9GAMM|nr:MULTISPECIES: iron-sulfur cluster carrier protein ApbC [Colwellia]GAW96196.1 iron-sulfur cluster carrier protein [Colwellia marinimaniae]